MLNATNLSHPTTQRNLFTSIHRAVRLSKRSGTTGTVYMKNRKGENFLRIRHCRVNGFSFHTNYQEHSKKVLTSLKASTKIDLQIK
jgi:hypothetical protein